MSLLVVLVFERVFILNPSQNTAILFSDDCVLSEPIRSVYIAQLNCVAYVADLINSHAVMKR